MNSFCKKTAFVSATLLLSLISCNRENVFVDTPDIPEGPMTICAGVDPMDKTALGEGNKVLWLDTDTLYIFNQEHKAACFSTVDNNVSEAEFSTRDWPGGKPCYAVHINPEADEHPELSSPSEAVLPVVFNHEQTVTENGTYARRASASAGKVIYDDGHYIIKEMKNVVSALSFRIEESKIEKIVAESIGDEPMAGWVNVDYDKLENGDADFWTPVEGKSRYSSITLIPGGEVLDDGCFKPGTYYLTLLPQKYGQGIRLSLFTKGSDKATVRTVGTNGGVEFRRGEIRRLSTGLDDPIPATVTIDLSFYNADNINPLGFGDKPANEESATGETYNYTFNYEYDGHPSSVDFPIVICKGSVSEARYHYKSYSLVWPEGTNGSILAFDKANGWILAPAVKGHVLQSILYEHGNAYAKQIAVKEPKDPANPKLSEATTIAYTSKETPVASSEGPSSDLISFYSNGFEGINVTANTKPGVPYFVQFTGNNGTRVYRLKLVYTPVLPKLPDFSQDESDFPKIIINTNDAEPIVDKETKVRGYIEYKDAKGMYPGPTAVADSMTISGRGNSTWTKFPKKPYKFTLDKKAGFFGLEKDKKWVLLANHSDKSLLRNVLVMKISSIMGFDWTPVMYPVEVWLNGKYIGLYTMSEHKKVSSGRVNIDTEAGDMYLEVDMLMDETTCFETDVMKVPVMFNDPEVPSEQQLSETKAYFREFENVLMSDGFADPETGYAKYVDVASLVNFYIIQELTKNCDGHLTKSAFITRTAADPRLRFYHVWDFDISLGNCNYLTDIQGIDNGPYGFLTREVGPHGRNTGWICYIFKDPAFEALVKERWKELYPALKGLNSFIDSEALSQKEAVDRNFKRWPALGKYSWPNVKWFNTYEEEVAYLKDYYMARLEWMNTQYGK